MIDVQQAGPMTYGDSYFVKVNNPSVMQRAVLIGVGAVTHHYDYGQRYVELLVRPSGQTLDLEILGPPVAAMAPPGYYMLFVLDNNNLPSYGKFVVVDF